MTEAQLQRLLDKYGLRVIKVTNTVKNNGKSPIKSMLGLIEESKS